MVDRVLIHVVTLALAVSLPLIVHGMSHYVATRWSDISINRVKSAYKSPLVKTLISRAFVIGAGPIGCFALSFMLFFILFTDSRRPILLAAALKVSHENASLNFSLPKVIEFIPNRTQDENAENFGALSEIPFRPLQDIRDGALLSWILIASKLAKPFHALDYGIGLQYLGGPVRLLSMPELSKLRCRTDSIQFLANISTNLGLLSIVVTCLTAIAQTCGLILQVTLKSRFAKPVNVL